MLAVAADPTGTITGTVTDPSGSAVPNAKLVVTSLTTGFSRNTITAADGGFVFPLMPVGRYSLTVEVSGFRRFEQRPVEVRADGSTSVPVALQIGALSDTVTVEAGAEMVETRSGTLANVVGQQKIVELPLNGRNAAALVTLAPGTIDLNTNTARGSGDTQQGATYPGAQSISSNGARADGVNYQLDGGSNIDHYTNVNNPFPNPDALEEFSVQTNNYSAETGRASGAVVNVVTRSGTNGLHGTLFEFLRNGSLNARNFFAPTSDKLKRNQFGGSLGGPVIKDKLFFFGTYQGTQTRNISTGNTTFVLTGPQRAGNFSSVSRQLIDPITKQPFPGNQIPANRIDPVTAKLLPLIPVSFSPDGFLVFDRPLKEHENQFMGRVDYNFTSHHLYSRYFYSKLPRDAVSGAQDLVRGTGGREFFSQSASVSDTYTATNRLINNLIFSYNYNNGQATSGAPFSLKSIGVDIAGPTPPEINIQVAGYFTLSSGAPGEFKRENFHFADTVHWVRGSHDIAFGGDFLRMKVDLNNSYRQAGRFRFRGSSYSGDPRTDFLLGAVERFMQGGGEYAARRGNLGSLFAQDSIRVGRGLVLNLGVRWDPFYPYTDELGRTECFVPGLTSQRFPKAPTGYLFAGDTGCPEGGSKAAAANVSPRIGFAYNLGGRSKTIVRGGFGVFYQPPFVEAYNNMVDSAPFSPQIQRFGVPFGNPYQGIRNPFPAEFAPTPPPKDAEFEKPVLGVSYATDWKPARQLSWNLTMEHQLRPDLLVRGGYVGSKGTHLGINNDVNAARYFPGAEDVDADERRPYKDFTQITQNISGGNSIYNSLQLGLDKRFSHGFTVGANYTFARSLDWVSFLTDLDGINVINPFNMRAYRGLSDFDVKHRFVLNYVWQLPSPSGALRPFLGGWETSGIWNWQSGFPLDIISGDDTSLTTIGNDQADVVSKPSLTGGSKADRINKWFTTEAFKIARLGTFGNAGRNILHGPGTFNIDFSAHKNFRITERWSLQYRAEFFNGLNHTNLNNPGSTVSSGGFGRITGAGSPRIIQMALKLRF
jgi:hypothetical protein